MVVVLVVAFYGFNSQATSKYLSPKIVNSGSYIKLSVVFGVTFGPLFVPKVILGLVFGDNENVTQTKK